MRKNAAKRDRGRPSSLSTCAWRYHHSVVEDACGGSCVTRSIGPGLGQSGKATVMRCSYFARRLASRGAISGAFRTPRVIREERNDAVSTEKGRTLHLDDNAIGERAMR